MNRILRLIFVSALSVIIFFSAWPIIQGDLNFHTDIARDFLLLEDVYYNKNPTLIGPRSGGISGVFHGPLWLYINLPAYVIGGGNPVAVGWFWVFLFVASIAVLFEVTRRMFDEKAAMIAALIYSSAMGADVYAFFNPNGAMILFPLFFYLFWMFAKKAKLIYLAASMFLLGCIIQFQMAFGVPLLILIGPYIVYRAIRDKKISYIVASSIIALPLSSYLLFELRHNFLQIRSVIAYMNNDLNPGQIDMSFRDLLYHRLNYMLSDTIGTVSYNTLWITFFVVFGILLGVSRNVKKVQLSNPYVLFLLLWGGYWTLILAYKGAVWGYYYFSFVGVVAMIFAASYKYFNRYIFAILFLGIMINNMQILYWKTIDSQEVQGRWSFFSQAAEMVYEDAPREFGYYIYTTDIFGYSTRYAMSYLNRKNTEKAGYADTKKETTYLMIDDPGDHISTNSRDWKQYDVRITGEPIQTIPVRGTYWIEKYKLGEEAQEIESNPNMLNSLIFR